MIRGAATLTLLVVTGCGVPLDSRPETVGDNQIPEGLRPVDSATPTVSERLESIDVWFVRDDRVVAVSHRAPGPVGPESAVDAVLEGPTEAEQGDKLRSAIPDAGAIIGVEAAGGVATVDLAATFADIPASDQVLALAQLVLTLTDLRGIGRVRFEVDDVQIAVPLPNGDTSEDSVSRDDFIDLSVSS